MKIKKISKKLLHLYDEKEKPIKHRIRVGSSPENERLRKQILSTIKEDYKRIGSTKRPQFMRYYENLLKINNPRLKEIKKHKRDGGKVIGYFCNFVPEELIRAAGAVPVRLDAGFYETVFPAENILPQDICPQIKSALGMKMLGLNPYFELCDAVVIPTPCDGKKKLAEILNNYLPVWILNLPATKDTESAMVYWLKEVRELKEKIEELTKNKISSKRLKETIQMYRKAQAVFRNLYEIKRNKPFSGSDLLLVMQALFYADIGRWTEETDKLCNELRKMKNNSSNSPRLLITGSPILWPNHKVLSIVEENAIIACDEFCSGTQFMYNPLKLDDWTMQGMIKAIAEQHLLPCTCPCFTFGEDRIDRVLEMIKYFKVDGIIYHILKSCQIYNMEFYKFSQVIGKKRPILRIETDYSKDDTEQIRTRVEAFVEMLGVKG